MRNFIGSRAIPDVSYFSPNSLEEALNLLDNLDSNVKILAGGTDTIPALRTAKLTLPDHTNVLNIKSVEDLKYIRLDNEILKIGATTTLTDIIESSIVKEKFSLLSEALSQIGSLQIRNWATIGGNICNASPAADAAIPLLALDTSLKLQSKNGDRMMPICEFFTGPGATALKSRELLTQILIPKPEGHAVFIKLGRRNTFTLSVVSVAVYTQVKEDTIKDIRIALGAVAPIPMRARNTEKGLQGKKLTEDAIEEAVRTIKEEVKPITDVRCCLEYRKDMSGELIRKALIKLWKE